MSLKLKVFDISKPGVEEDFAAFFAENPSATDMLITENFVGYTYKDKSDLGPSKQSILIHLADRLTKTTKKLAEQELELARDEKALETYAGSDDQKASYEEAHEVAKKNVEITKQEIEGIASLMKRIENDQFPIVKPF